MTAREHLRRVWGRVSTVALRGGNKGYEGVFITEKWKTFDGFYNDNVGRYYRARTKWKNYKRITPVNKNVKHKRTHIIFIRKVKSLGYTKENTCFTSASDCMKFHKTSHKIIIGDKVLGTRDIKNILKKTGVELAGILSISNRMKNGRSPFIDDNRLKKYKWKGKNLPLHEIAKKENITFSLLSNKIHKEKMSIEVAVDYCKRYVPPTTYLFEGEKLLPSEICKILSDRTGIKETTLRGRFMRWGYDLNKLVIKKSTNKYAPYPKSVVAEKENEKIIFNSIREAANTLGINPSNISTYVNGKKTGKLKGYTFSLVHPHGDKKMKRKNCT